MKKVWVVEYCDIDLNISVSDVIFIKEADADAYAYEMNKNAKDTGFYFVNGVYLWDCNGQELAKAKIAARKYMHELEINHDGSIKEIYHKSAEYFADLLKKAGINGKEEEDK